MQTNDNLDVKHTDYQEISIDFDSNSIELQDREQDEIMEEWIRSERNIGRSRCCHERLQFIFASTLIAISSIIIVGSIITYFVVLF